MAQTVETQHPSAEPLPTSSVSPLLPSQIDEQLQPYIAAIRQEFSEQLEAETERRKAAERLTDTLRKRETASTAPHRLPPVTADALRAKVGEHAWNHQLTRAERGEAVGGSAGATDADVLRYFGKASDPKDASELMRTNPGRYKQMREYAKAKGLFGA